MPSIKHVAIIMDGNGRWAKERRKPRVWGHVRGAKVISRIVEEALDKNLDSLTLYAFSTENWKRPRHEISILFRLLKKFLIIETERILSENIKFKVIGDVSPLPADTIQLIESLEGKTKHKTGLTLVFAFNYGARDEMAKAVKKLLADHQAVQADDVTAEALGKYFFLPEINNLDLLIRTGGELRVSNFLLWQLAYAELYFTETYWPNFTKNEFSKIIDQVNERERRFGEIHD